MDLGEYMTYEELEGKLHQVESQRSYWKNEYETLKKRMKEKDRNYLMTNAEKTKRILELEAKVKSLEVDKQMTIFDY